MMRLNIKVALICLCVGVLIVTFSLWTICGESNLYNEWNRRMGGAVTSENKELDLQGGEEIDCDINGEYMIGCRKEGDEVYVPFSFLHKYFEVYGKLTTYDGLERFEWSHSYSKIYYPKGKYDPKGVFMYFENYNVEVRDRVKCVSATESVPVSTQWESQGYYYPTQIAQFGLSHYSKNLTEPEPRRKIIEDGDRDMANWSGPPVSTIERVFDGEIGSSVLQFATTETFSNSLKLKMDHVLDFVLSVNVLLKANSSFTVVLQNREKKEIYNLHYISSEILLTAQDNNFYYGIGTAHQWKKLTRDLVVDLQKGIGYLDIDRSKRKIPRSKLKIAYLILHGHGAIDNLTISSSEHIQQFYDAANWFIKNQDPETGGWPINVRRKLASGFLDLESGWYSSMGQGHAISLLARAYHHSNGDPQYLMAAVKALKPFKVPSSKGGVLARFLDKYPWYEEYPTQPPSFVLNGFIYSLLGLYDLATIAPNLSGDAQLLFDEGMVALKNMVTLFDMGSVTAYDLRHFTLGIAPNLARWDYHATHVNQLLLMSTIDGDPLFSQTAERWIGYMSGKRAAHN